MNFSYKKHFNQKTGLLLVGVLAFFGNIICNKGFASASGSSWSKQSNWASEESSPSRHNATLRDNVSADLSPFSPGSNNLALDLGQVFLMGDLSKYSDSIGAQLHYTYGVSEIFGFDTSFGYSEHSNGLYSMTTLLSGLRMNLSWYDKIIPYFIFGLGFYRPNYVDTTAPSSATSNSISAVLFGVHLGPGIDLELSRNLFFGTAVTFHNMFGTTKEKANGSPLNIGGTYTSFFLHVGTTF